MSRRAKVFDQLVTHIEKRLEAQGSAVTWLDQTLDPDDATEPRAIDIAIQRDGLLILVEIRDHKLAEPTAWLADFANRRRNLKADAAIAVTALKIDEALDRTAASLGIILRPLTQLSDPEVDNWGTAISVDIVSIEFQKLHLQASVKEADAPLISATPSIDSSRPGENAVAALVAFLRKSFHDKIRQDWSRWKVDLEHSGMAIDGAPVQALTVIFEARLVHARVDMASCVIVPSGKHPFDGELLVVDLSQQAQAPNRLLHDVVPASERPPGPRAVKIVGGDAMAQSRFDVVTLDVIALPGMVDVVPTQ